MAEYLSYLMLFITGIAGGFLGGLIGVGGGVIFIPILNYFLSQAGFQEGVLVKAVLANSLFAIVFTGTMVSYRQYKAGNFFPKEIAMTAIPGIFSALLMSAWIEKGDWYSKTMFNILFASLLLPLLINMFRKKSIQTTKTESKSVKAYGLVGLLTGIVSSLSGLGGGVIMVPAFTDFLHTDIRKASSVSSGVIPLFALPMTMYYAIQPFPLAPHSGQIGYISLPIVLPVIIGAIIGSPLGVKIAQKASSAMIRIVFAIFVSLVFIKMLYEIF